MGISFFKPECSMPTFQMQDGTMAYMCGNFSGKLYASIIIFIILIIVFFYNLNKYDLDENGKKVKKVRWNVIIPSLGLCICIWIFLPKLLGLIKSRSFEGYQKQLKILESSGMSKADALNRIQGIYQTEQTSNSLNNIAGAMTGRGMLR